MAVDPRAATAPDDADDGDDADEVTSDDVPDYAHTVVVPVDNPDTALDLLRLARAIVRGDGGRVLALSVALGDADAEQSAERIERLEKVLADEGGRLAEPAGSTGEGEGNGHRDEPAFELLRRSASTVARGILDTVRETGADMVLLGVREPERGRVDLGPIVQGVVAAAGCDVLLFRSGRALGSLDDLDRIVVGVDESSAARAAARLGIILGKGLTRPVDVLNVVAGGQPRYEGYRVIDRALHELEGRHDCRTRVVAAVSAAAGLTSEADRDDLVIVGFSGRSEFREWLAGDVARRVFDRAAGPVIAVSRHAEPAGLRSGARRVVDWLRPKLTDIEQETIIWRSHALATTSLDYMTLTVVSALLASLGLLLNSVAVVIGAMLVAPLMGPLVAFSVGLRAAQLDTVRRSVMTIVVGAGSAFAVSGLIGLLVPLGDPTAEILARGSPTVLDAGVALASGIVGAYATARKDIPSALAGVAVAAALIPPICASGLALGLGRTELASGAALLFTVNIVCIAATGTLVFAWLGLEPTQEATPGQRHVAVLTGLLLPVIIGVLIAVNATRFAVDEALVEDLVAVILPAHHLGDMSVPGADPPTVIATLRGEVAPTEAQVAALHRRLEEELGVDDLRLEVVFERMVAVG